MDCLERAGKLKADQRGKTVPFNVPGGARPRSGATASTSDCFIFAADRLTTLAIFSCKGGRAMKLERAFIRDGDTTTSRGTVQAHPQRWPVTCGDDGRHACFEGDPVVCFEAREIMATPAATAWMAYAGHTQPLSRYDEFFVVHDAATGRPVQCFSYGIKTRGGEHHDALYDDGATAKAYAEDAQPMSLTYLVQTRMGIRS
jgi:hypothetical protein